MPGSTLITLSAFYETLRRLCADRPNSTRLILARGALYDAIRAWPTDQAAGRSHALSALRYLEQPSIPA